MRLISKNEKAGGLSEEDLIAYQMGECSRWQAWQIRRALERDPALAEEAAQIAATLRAFSADAAPAIDDALLARTWSAVRPSLPVLEARRAPSGLRVWAAGFGGVAVGAALVLVLLTHVKVVHETPGNVASHPSAAPVTNASSTTPNVEQTQQEIEQYRPGLGPLHNADNRPQYYHGKPGPITQTPEDLMATEGGLAAHLDASERVLTELNHEDGPMPAVTHAEVHRLLLENALYEERARVKGDYAAASVMDDLGRALTSLDADPPKSASGMDAFRVEFNVGGTLFDLHVLHDSPAHE